MELRRPDLTLPAAEAEALRAAYSSAKTVLEYGAGGSTLMAAELGAEVWAVESDPAWAQMMQDWFGANPTAGRAHILHADIGPTKEWGHPKDESAFRNWPGYALKFWELRDVPHPDVVLIDGRFRLASFMATAFHITRPVTLYFDDYLPRPAYHKAEQLLKPSQIIGRMARFDLLPIPLTPDRLGAFARAMLQPA